MNLESSKEQRRLNETKVKLTNERGWPKAEDFTEREWEDLISKHEAKVVIAISMIFRRATELSENEIIIF